MTIERTILILAWASVVLVLTLFVPKAKRREACIIFFAAHLFTWISSLFLVEFKFVENPVREFVKASGTNFTFNYVFYPTYFVLYCLHYPQSKSLVTKIVYILAVPALLVPIVYWIEQNTLLINNIKIKWSYAYLWLVANSYVVEKYTKWFFHRFRTEETR